METNSRVELALEFGRAMSEMKSKLRQQIQVKINDFDPDLSFELLEIIGLLWRKNGIHQHEIGTIVSKDKSSVTYLLNRLVKRGLVVRVKNPSDRRHKQIFLTELGRQKRKDIYPLVLEAYQLAAGNIDPEELMKSIQVVREMTRQMDMEK